MYIYTTTLKIVQKQQGKKMGGDIVCHHPFFSGLYGRFLRLISHYLPPYLVGKLRTGFEGGYGMSRNREGRILVDITRYFLGASFENKATKSADVDRFARRE